MKPQTLLVSALVPLLFASACAYDTAPDVTEVDSEVGEVSSSLETAHCYLCYEVDTVHDKFVCTLTDPEVCSETVTETESSLTGAGDTETEERLTMGRCMICYGGTPLPSDCRIVSCDSI